MQNADGLDVLTPLSIHCTAAQFQRPSNLMRFVFSNRVKRNQIDSNGRAYQRYRNIENPHQKQGLRRLVAAKCNVKSGKVQ